MSANKHSFLDFVLTTVAAVVILSVLGFVLTSNPEVPSRGVQPRSDSPPKTPSQRGCVAEVVSVGDGDSLRVLIDGQQHRLRLAGIDAPELDQPYGREARQFLSDLCFGETVEIIDQGRDDYGRILADVRFNAISVQQELLAIGLAWHYKRFNDDPEFARLESDARRAGRGLWADRNPSAPWQWRDQHTVR